MTRPTLGDEQDFLRVAYYGDPGTGKTTQMLGLARIGRTVVVDADRGLKPAALRRHGIDPGQIEPIREIEYAGLDRLAHEMIQRIRDGEQIAGVIWDTATMMLPYLQDPISAKGYEKAQMRGADRSEFLVTLDERGEVVEAMRRLMRKMMDVPAHFVIGCHLRRDKDEEDAIRVGPSLSPALVGYLSGYADIVVHMRTEEVGGKLEHVGLTKPQGRFYAKDRFGLLPTLMADPSFDRILAYVTGELTPATDEVQKAARERRKSGAPA